MAAARLSVLHLEDRLTPSPVPLSPAEQYFLELTNRGRANPLAEAARYGISLNEGLLTGTISSGAKQPLVSNPVLLGTIRSHLADLQTHDIFQHNSSDGTTFSQRMTAAGYNYSAGENLAVTTRRPGGETVDVEYLYQLLFVDTDIVGRGHRVNLMRPDWVEVGSGFHTGPFAFSPGGTRWDSAFVGQDFGAGSGQTHYLTGVVYNDALVRADDFYTPGEGLGGVTVTAATGGNIVYTETTNGAGGYQLALPAGTYDVFASGPGLAEPVAYYGVSIGSQNVKRDFRPGGGQAPPGWGLTASSRVFAVGADGGAAPWVKVFDAGTGAEKFRFMAYDPVFRGGVRVVTADVNGDGVQDFVTAPGPGGGPNIKVFNGATYGLITNFMAYDAAYTGGVNLTAGNFDADPAKEIAVGTGAGGGPNVRVFDVVNGSASFLKSALANFMAYSPAFLGGVNVAAGNVDGTGTDELIVGAGAGGGPHVQVFRHDGGVYSSFFAYNVAYTGGVYVAAGDITGDGRAEILTGTGLGGGPNAKIIDAQNGTSIRDFMAYDPAFRGGVRVAVVDADGTGKKEIVVAAGPGGGPHFRQLDGPTLSQRLSQFAFDTSFTGGIWIG